MDRASYLARARHRGVNPFVYWVVRVSFQLFFHGYFRMRRIGLEHVHQDGPMIIAANHRSFLDPFLLGTLVRRPLYFVAKQELFRRPLTAWFLSALGAFPIDRGNADGDAMAVAREILQRGDVVVIFPEGTRVRPGALGLAKRGVGRLALETGAPVLPVALLGTEHVRKGWRIRPRKVRIRIGAPLRFPRVESPSPELARAVTERIWPCVALQWEWLGGAAPIRRVAIAGDGVGAARLADGLRRAGVEVAAVSRDGADGLGAVDLVVSAGPPQQLSQAVAALGLRVAPRAVATVDGDGRVACADRGVAREVRQLLSTAGPASADRPVVAAEVRVVHTGTPASRSRPARAKVA